MSTRPSVGDHGRLLASLFAKELVMMARYHVDFVASLAGGLALFALVFFGGRVANVQAITDSLGVVVVGFFLYSMATRAFRSTTTTISRESSIGTLQQLYMTPFGTVRILSLNVVVHLTTNLVVATGMLLVMLVLTGETLALNVAPVVLVSLLTLVPVAGLGFVLGGLAMLYKSVGSVSNLVTFPIIGLIATPVGRIPFGELLPLALGSHLLRRVMIDGRTLLELPAYDLGLLAGKAVVYFAVGVAIFLACQRRARRLGVLGHY